MAIVTWKVKTNSTRREIAQRLQESAALKQEMAENQAGEIEAVVHIIIRAISHGGKVVLFGNGGSAADAQHIAAELVGQFALKRQALPAVALTTNASVMTAIGNDYGYELVFSRQVEALVREGDVVIGISTTGNSPNVIRALTKAKTMGARVVALTGGSGGGLARVAELSVIVPSQSTPRIQEAHITIGHIVCEMVEKELAVQGQNATHWRDKIGAKIG